MEDSHIINDLFNCAPVFTSSEASEQGRQPVSVFPDEFRFFLIMDDLVDLVRSRGLEMCIRDSI